MKLLLLASMLVGSSAKTGISNQLYDNSESLNFLLHGDWGWNSFNQSLTAYEMGVYAWILDASFVVALGDNFYDDGVASTSDNLWETVFHDIYAFQSLNIPWYAILGNHDYHGSVSSQVERTYTTGEAMWTMPSTYYAQTFALPDGGTIFAVFIDTQLLDPYQKDTEAILSDPNWQDKRQRHLDWIDGVLGENKDDATWVVVMGHYPIYSIGEHGDDSYLINDLEPILIRHKVHAYFTAHDHNHQHFQINGIRHFITGNSAGRGPFGPHGWQFQGISQSTPYMEVVFQACGFSFAQVNSKHFNVSFVDNFGNVRFTEIMDDPNKRKSMLSEMFHEFGLTPLLTGLAIIIPMGTLAVLAISYMGKDSLSGYKSWFPSQEKITLEMDASVRSTHGLMSLPVHIPTSDSVAKSQKNLKFPTFDSYRRDTNVAK